jgi:hypothetical protein
MTSSTPVGIEVVTAVEATVGCVDLSLSAAEWELVHELRLRGLMAADDDRCGRLVEIEIVVQRGRMVTLSAVGRELHANWARYDDETEARAAALRLFDDFEELNQELLAVCSAWQIRPGGVPNDHRDAKYDWDVIGRLERLHERAAPRIRRVARVAARFADYDRRLRHALRKVIDEGETDWFTSPRLDSYHTVWNQMHEDLLLALGLPRTTT